MKTDPCAVCGETNTKLIDGFYYCTECGTQDVNTQETVVETVFLDGTINLSSKWKIRAASKNTTQMTKEWRKWHAFNFIMLGTVKQLMDLGASSGFKDQVLWIWTRYMNMFMDKDQMGAINEDEMDLIKSIFIDADENDNKQKNNKSGDYEKQDENKQNEIKFLKESVKKFTCNVLVSILYLALLFDNSSIQLSHLIQFMNEKRLTLRTWLKFIPKELDVTGHPEIEIFQCSARITKDFHNVYRIAMSLVKVLDLGTPPLPDVRKMVENYVTELCLPNSFKNLVLSLLLQCPCNGIMINRICKASCAKLPKYEAEIMSYILVALKMCFGLDDDYETKISDAVEKINDDENHVKSYKLGMHSDPTNRLFSFREWTNYLQYRRILLCKQYLPIADKHNVETDDYVFMEHLVEKPKKPIKLMDEITMDILNKIPPTNEGQVIPKSEFVVSLTPLSSYTEVVTRYIQDPEVKLLLSEDFTQYSLSYACEYLKLDINGENTIKGVTKENKVFNNRIVGNLIDFSCDLKEVYVRNCENKNWFKTNPPNVEHIVIGEGKSDIDNEDGNDFDLESKLAENQVNNTTQVYNKKTLLESTKDTAVAYEQESVLSSITDNSSTHNELMSLENITEENEDILIYDDPFDDEVALNSAHNKDTENDKFEFWKQLKKNENEKHGDLNSETSLIESFYNPETFDRANVIKELVLHACRKYKITIPNNLKRYISDRPIKRPRNETISKNIINKKLKTTDSTYREGRIYTERIMSAYNASIEKDLLNKVSEHVNSFAEMIHLNNVATPENDVSDDMMTDKNQDVDKSKDIMEVGNETTAIEDPGKGEIDDVDSSPKVDPDFDEKTHDVRQLYIKCREKLQFEDIFDIHDPEIEKVLEKKIMEYRDKEILTTAKELRGQHNDDSLDVLSDADSEDTSSLEDDSDTVDIENLPNLICYPEEVEEFGYWNRYYQTLQIWRNNTRSAAFEDELKESMPKSFLFILKQCASIITCSPFTLYKCMMYIENLLFKDFVKVKCGSTKKKQKK